MAFYSSQCVNCKHASKKSKGTYYGKDDKGKYYGSLYDCENYSCEIKQHCCRKKNKQGD